MKKCKHIKCGYRFYIKVVKSYRQYFDFTGEPSAQEDDKDRDDTIAYCENCNARIGKVTGYTYAGHAMIDGKETFVDK